MDHDSKTNEIRVKKLLGLDERKSPDNNDDSDFDICRGLYPSKFGLLSRLPGSTILARVGEGDERVFGYCQPFDGSGNVIIQTDVAVYTATLDELLGREVTEENLTFDDLDEEETMSMAIIMQQESNDTNGGSAQGQQTSADSSSAADTWYPRRLTTMPVNESSTVVDFDPSTGGGGSTSTQATFELSPATYRIEAWAAFNFSGLTSTQDGAALFALYNVTDSAFQLQTDNTTYLVSTVARSKDSGEKDNQIVVLCGRFTVSSTNKIFTLKHKGTSQAAARDPRFGGRKSGLTSTTGGAITGTTPTPDRFTFIKILKETA